MGLGSPIPDRALLGGKDRDGSIIYVARSLYAGIKLPAKAIPSKRACYVSFGGLEILVERFEVIDRIVFFLRKRKKKNVKRKSCKNAKRVGKLQVLTGDASCFLWESSSHGKSAPNALSTDKIGYEEIFVGRAFFSDSLTIGRIQPSHHCLYISHDGREHQVEHYEVLVYRKQPQVESLIDLGQPMLTRCRTKTLNRVNALTTTLTSQRRFLYSLRPSSEPTSQCKLTKKITSLGVVY